MGRLIGSLVAGVGLVSLALLWNVAKPASRDPSSDRNVAQSAQRRQTLNTVSYAGTGSIGGTPNVVDLTDSSSVVVVGTATVIQDSGSTAILVNGQSVEVYVKTAQVDVARSLKGNAPPVLLVEFYVGKEMDLESPGVPLSQIGLLFLKAGQMGGFALTDLQIPIIDVRGSAPEVTGEDVDQVLAELAQVALTTDEDPSYQRESLFLLRAAMRRPEGASAAGAIRTIATNPQSPVQFDAAAILLEQNDISVLDAVSKVLLESPDQLDSGTIQWLGAALSDGVTDKAAISTLTQLLSSPNLDVRAGASNALRHTQAAEAIEPLAHIALDDRDQIVRYHAVIGLAEITGLDDWGPSLGEYQQNEEKYLGFWRQWRTSLKRALPSA